MSKGKNQHTQPERKFPGELFPDKNNTGHEKRRLKAYLRGWERFQHGKDENQNPIYFKTVPTLPIVKL